MKLLFAFLACCAALVAQPSLAQLSTGASGQSTAPRMAANEEYWRMLRAMGDCLANSKTEKAEAFLDAPIDSPEELRAFRSLFGDTRNRCMRNFVSATMVTSWVRGSVAEGLFRRNDRAGRQVPADYPAPETIASLHDFARCYVAGNPDSAKAFLRETKMATSGETERLREMAPGFASCLPAVEVALDPTDIRMAIAEAMYHATRAPSS